MDKIVIEGGVPLRGEIRISGSKNAALPSLFAALLTDNDCVLENVPALNDIDTACSLLEVLGKKVYRDTDSVRISAGAKILTEAPYELVRKMRASVLVLGPLLARTGRAGASLPGGCAIGNRPINFHLSGFEQLGAKTILSQGMVRLSAKRLRGKRIVLPFASVGATENLLMAGVLAKGQTVIENAAREPEIADFCDFLKKMGGDISGAGSGRIIIQGKNELRGAHHTVIPDRIETATYLIAAAATKGKIQLGRAQPAHVKNVVTKLLKAGVEIEFGNDGSPSGIATISCSYKKPFRPVNIVTSPYPSFPTDVQAQWMALMSLADGTSVIEESVFENRYLHAAELRRMGANIEIRGNRAAVRGVQKLSGANVMVSDLRAGAALVIAGLAAEGRTVIHRVYHLDRGYESVEKKLRAVGARIKRVR